jgi:cation/acetate symporter
MAHLMQDQRDRQRAKIDGLAAFAGAAFLISIGLVYLLARVGAPDGLVHAMGPFLALAGVALLGALARSSRVPGFFAADRAVPPPYGGLGFAATAAGFVLCLDFPNSSPLPFVGVAGGLCLNVLVVAPLLRASKASGLADLLATRFPNPLLRLYLAALQVVIGALVAAAGFATAINRIVTLFEPSRSLAAAIAAFMVACIVVPGGLAGLLWGGAVSAGAILIILALPIAGNFVFGAAAPAEASLANVSELVGELLAPAWRHSHGSGDPAVHFLFALATGLAIATLPPFMSGAIASPGERSALRAGGLGLAFAIVIALAAAFDLGLPMAWTGPMASGFGATAGLLAALILSAAGVLSAGRAWGMTMTRRPQDRYAPLASQRLARSRAAMIAILAACALVAVREPLDPRMALAVAGALSLGCVTPLIAFALFSRASNVQGFAGALTALATVVLLVVAERLGDGWERLEPGRLLVGALASAAAGFVAGWAAGVFSPRANEPPPARHDLFVDAPLDRSS